MDHIARSNRIVFSLLGLVAGFALCILAMAFAPKIFGVVALVPLGFGLLLNHDWRRFEPFVEPDPVPASGVFGFLAALVGGGCALVYFATPAAAADAIVIPWGDWTAGALAYLREIIVASVLAAFGYVLRGLPTHVRGVVEALRVEQLLDRGLDFGLAAVEGAVKGKTLEIKTANAVLNAVASYAASNAPALAGKLGETLKPKILARMSAQGLIPAEASAEALGVVLPAK